MVVKAFTYEQFHNKKGVGSTRLRIHNLLKYWDEASLYQYGEKPDVLIYQKVYKTFDYTLPLKFPCTKILDVCDPDFRDTPDIHIVETMNAMDAVVVPTQAFGDFLQQMTSTPVHVIKDRFDLSDFPDKKVHKGTAKTLVWFGYSHNIGNLKLAIPSIERRGLDLLIISDQDPFAYRWAMDSEAYEKKYKFIKFDLNTFYKDMQTADICVLPKNNGVFDIFKSENKTVQAQLLGLPVANTAEEIDALMTAQARNSNINAKYDTLKVEYDCRQSVKEYKDIINAIRS